MAKLHWLAALVLASSTQALASMTCSEFTALGVKAATVKELVSSDATPAQIDQYKRIIASHASRVAFVGISSRARALKLLRRDGLLVEVVRDTLALTRAQCFHRPSDSLDSLATDNFNNMLDVVVQKMGC